MSINTEASNNGSLNVLVMGSGAIGTALTELIVQTNPAAQCILTYRNGGSRPTIENERIHLRQLDGINEGDYIDLAADLKETFGNIHWLINTIGVLHNEAQDIFPEKRVSDFEVDSFRTVMGVNVLPTMLAAKHLLPLFDRSSLSVFSTISAKVGSIEDNRLGGWYSYRASKACLNMMLKNLSIEFKQKNKKLCVLALHPGTTASNLSAPFQKNVPEEKLFSPQRTAQQLLAIIEKASPIDSGSFYSWDGSKLPW